jgi:hypothetical protein
MLWQNCTPPSAWNASPNCWGELQVQETHPDFLNNSSEAIHEPPVLIPPREKTTRKIAILVGLGEVLHICETGIGKNICCKGKNGANTRIVPRGIDMPNLIAVSPHLVHFTFRKTKSQAIIFPHDVEKMSMNNALQPCNQIPFQCQKTTGK